MNPGEYSLNTVNIFWQGRPCCLASRSPRAVAGKGREGKGGDRRGQKGRAATSDLHYLFAFTLTYFLSPQEAGRG
jgi:hypothetical protein